MQTCKRQFFLIDLDKRLHQRHIFRSAELDHAALRMERKVKSSIAAVCSFSFGSEIISFPVGK